MEKRIERTKCEYKVCGTRWKWELWELQFGVFCVVHLKRIFLFFRDLFSSGQNEASKNKTIQFNPRIPKKPH